MQGVTGRITTPLQADDAVERTLDECLTSKPYKELMSLPCTLYVVLTKVVRAWGRPNFVTFYDAGPTRQPNPHDLGHDL